MVDDRPEQTGSPPDLGTDLGRPKRPAPTIDLDATEVRTAADASAEASANASGATSSASAHAPQTSEADPEPVSEAKSEPESQPSSKPMPRPRRASAALLGAGSGAVAAVLVIGIASVAGWPAQPAAPEQPSPQSPQVSGVAFDALTARVAKVESRPLPSASATPSAPDPALAVRLDGLEKAVASLRSDLAATRSQSERTAAAVNDLKSAPPAAVPAPDLSAINARIGQVERAAGALKTEAAQQSAKPADDKPLRRVVAASLLDGSVRQSEPYEAALAQAKSLAVDANALKPLDAFAALGVPNAAIMSRDLLEMLSKLAPAPEMASAGNGIVDRLQAGAVRLLRIQRTDAVAGDDRDAIVARIGAAAKRSDLAEARREINSLSPADRAVVLPWIERLDARDAALAASRQFAADAMAALNKPAL